MQDFLCQISGRGKADTLAFPQSQAEAAYRIVILQERDRSRGPPAHQPRRLALGIFQPVVLCPLQPGMLIIRPFIPLLDMAFLDILHTGSTIDLQVSYILWRLERFSWEVGFILFFYFYSPRVISIGFRVGALDKTLGKTSLPKHTSSEVDTYVFLSRHLSGQNSRLHLHLLPLSIDPLKPLSPPVRVMRKLAFEAWPGCRSNPPFVQRTSNTACRMPLVVTSKAVAPPCAELSQLTVRCRWASWFKRGTEPSYARLSQYSPTTNWGLVAAT